MNDDKHEDDKHEDDKHENETVYISYEYIRFHMKNLYRYPDAEFTVYPKINKERHYDAIAVYGWVMLDGVKQNVHVKLYKGGGAFQIGRFVFDADNVS